MSSTYSPGQMIPFTETFVEASASTSITTTIALVGQVLNNGQTNFVGINNGSAEYILSTSAPGAQETTLADGHTYFVSSGPAPSNAIVLNSGSSTITTSVSASTSGTSSHASSSGSTTTAATTSGAGASTAAQSSSSSTHTGVAAPAAVVNGGVTGLVLGFLAMVGFLV